VSRAAVAREGVPRQKGLKVQFCGGPTPEDLDAVIRALGDGLIDSTLWLGNYVGLGAWPTLRRRCAIRTIVDPRRN
jgi:hypothetical protein